MTQTEIKAVVQAQRAHFASGATLSYSARMKALTGLEQAILRHEEELNRALKLDLGKSAAESYLCEIGMTLSEITWMKKHLKKLMREKSVPTPLAQFAARSFQSSAPYGTVLIMSPWNYPVLLTLEPLVDALAAGNTIAAPSSGSCRNERKTGSKATGPGQTAARGLILFPEVKIDIVTEFTKVYNENDEKQVLPNGRMRQNHQSNQKERINMANRIVLNTISYHGKGAIENIIPELTARGYQKAFVCTDPDLIKFGVAAKVTDLLDAAAFPYAVYSDIKANPTIANVQNGVEAFKASGADCIVAIGGGSAMDTAKAIGIIINNPEFADVRSLEGVAPTKKHAVFTIAVPTTAGTAAEVTINYVITDVEKKRKFVCVDTNDIPEIAVVDPDMMSTMPKSLTAATGMDALTHAIEGYITKGACAISDMFHLEAIRLISLHLRGAVANTPEGREGMALGQYIAGMGFSNVGLGIVHSMAHGLSALYDTPHGVACAILLPVGLEYNAPVAGERYRAVGKAMGVEGIDAMTADEAAAATIAAVKQLSADVGIPSNLKGILKEEDVQFLSESAFADACCPGNPRDTSVEEIAALYRSQM